MKDDFDVIVRKFPRKDIKIYGIFDVHLGAKEHLHKAFMDFRDAILRDPDAYVILGGDLINNAIKTSVSNCYEETMRPREQKRVMTEILKPLVDDSRVICCVPGNHERRNKDVDDDPTYDICCKLDIEDLYRPTMAFVKLQFGEQAASGAKNPTYRIFVHHGAGGGILTGGSVNRAERYAYTLDGIDLMMIGHTHTIFATAPAKLVFDGHNNRVTKKPMKIASMGSWLAYGGYAGIKMLMPKSTADEVPQLVVLHGDCKWAEVRM
jgi:predicted MPP superfamily phosphohydrolase